MTKRKRRELAREETEVASRGNGGEVKTADKSLYVPQDTKLKNPVDIRCRYRWSERQQTILDTAGDKATKLVMIDAYWGTGKSAMAVFASLQAMNEKKVSGIVYVRNPLEATNTAKIGTLPGTLDEKMAPFNAILYDKLNEFLAKPDIDRLQKEGRLECYPVGFVQGKTFAAKAVIIDEAASLSYDDLMLVVSRLGEHSKLFIVGDSTFQLSIGAKSGFARFFEIFSDQESMDNGVFTFELKRAEDIKRSGLLRFVMQKTGVIKEPISDDGHGMFPP